MREYPQLLGESRSQGIPCRGRLLRTQGIQLSLAKEIMMMWEMCKW
jgi:hypothetical protein